MEQIKTLQQYRQENWLFIQKKYMKYDPDCNLEAYVGRMYGDYLDIIGKTKEDVKEHVENRNQTLNQYIETATKCISNPILRDTNSYLQNPKNLNKPVYYKIIVSEDETLFITVFISHERLVVRRCKDNYSLNVEPSKPLPFSIDMDIETIEEIAIDVFEAALESAIYYFEHKIK